MTASAHNALAVSRAAQSHPADALHATTIVPALASAEASPLPLMPTVASAHSTADSSKLENSCRRSFAANATVSTSTSSRYTATAKAHKMLESDCAVYVENRPLDAATRPKV